MDASRYYRILGISENAGIEEIKQAFRRKAKAWHPDINKSEEAHSHFIDINEAYTYLLDLHGAGSGEFSGRLSKDEYYRQWTEKVRQHAREKAAENARMRFEEFRRSEVYRTTRMLSHLLDFFLLFLGVFIIIAAGIGLYSAGIFIERNGEEVLNTGGIVADLVITIAGIIFISLSWSNIKAYRSKRKKEQ